MIWQPLISAITALPGARGISLSLTRIVKRFWFQLERKD
jgi:hypothetical protein